MRLQNQLKGVQSLSPRCGGRVDETTVRIIGILALLVCSGVLKGHAEAQEPNEAVSCWWVYASCATESFGDQNWRSICYADFSTCLGQTKLPTCPPGGEVSDCSVYVEECRELADNDATLMQQCDEDHDACLLAHGC
jgi:hypothetical protein